MTSDETLRERIDELESRVSELSQQLRRVADERDAALREVTRLRGEPSLGVAVAPAAPATDGAVVTCGFCDGEGVYWVHDFEMSCKRCDGTGYTTRVASDVSTERH